MVKTGISRTAIKKPPKQRRGGRFAVKLLFQWRPESASSTVRLCEERIIIILATGLATALRAAERRGRAEEFRYTNKLGARVAFEFVGVTDICELDICDSDEVWYDVRRIKQPMERRALLTVHMHGKDDLVRPKRRTKLDKNRKKRE